MDFPRLLVEQLRAGRVIPFVGAGVSMAVQERETGSPLFPGWRDLLVRAADWLQSDQKLLEAQLVRALVELGPHEYLEAAVRARKAMEANWYQFLKKELNPERERVRDESLAVARAIWGLGSKFVITTNFDRVLLWGCPHPENLEIWDIQAPAEQAAALQFGVTQPTLWHLHGRIDNASSLILTPDGYRKMYPGDRSADQQYQAALTTLRTLLASHTFLFVGFGMEKHIGTQIESVGEIFSGASAQHFVLVHQSEASKMTALGLPIRVITFSDFGAPLVELLEAISAVHDSSPVADASVARPLTVGENTRTRFPAGPVFHVPFRQRGDLVIGRERILAELREQLTLGPRTALGHTAALIGIGGLGKTQVAVEYAYKFRDTYDNGVIWLNADQDIDAQLAEIAEKAKWLAPASEYKNKLEAARQQLRTASDCLIVFDNVEDFGTIEPYLPVGLAEPHLLITSRREQRGFYPVRLDPLPPELALRLLVQEAGREPRANEEASALLTVEMLGGLPLALEMAGGYLRYRQSVSWVQYAGGLQRNLLQTLSGKHFHSFTQHAADIYSTLSIGEDVFLEEPRLRSVLDLIGWSGSAPMGLSLITALLDVAEVELVGPLSLGVSLRILQKAPDADRYAIHRLLGEVWRQNMPIQEHLSWAETVCERILNWFVERREDFSKRPQIKAEINHIQTWARIAEQYLPARAPHMLWVESDAVYSRSNMLGAQNTLLRALDVMKRHGLEDLELEAHIKNDLSVAYSNAGELRLAMSTDEEALRLRLQLFGENHPDTARSFSNIATDYYIRRDFGNALKYERKALATTLSFYGESHPRTAYCYNELSTLYLEMGEHKRALEFALKALEIRLSSYGERHPDTAGSFASLGNIYDRFGHMAEAFISYERALKIRSEILGDNDPETLDMYFRLSAAYVKKGEHARALELAEKGMTGLVAMFGEGNLSTAEGFEKMASAYIRVGDYVSALEFAKKSRLTLQELLGEDHPSTLAAAKTLVSAMQHMGDEQVAVEFLKTVLDRLPQDHPSYGSMKELWEALDVRTRKRGFRHDPGRGGGKDPSRKKHAKHRARKRR